MKELLEDYLRRYKTINEMIRIETDPDTLTRLNTKSICYRDFIIEVERKIKEEKEIAISTKMDMFINSFNTDTNNANISYLQKGFFPYLGEINLKVLTPMFIIQLVHEAGHKQGIESGKWEKIQEIKKVLDIKDED